MTCGVKVAENQKGSSMLLMKKWKAFCEEQWAFTYISFLATSLMIFQSIAFSGDDAE